MPSEKTIKDRLLEFLQGEDPSITDYTQDGTTVTVLYDDRSYRIVPIDQWYRQDRVPFRVWAEAYPRVRLS